MERTLCIKNGSDRSYSYIHKRDKTPQLDNFALHTHKNFEVLVFLSGDAEFIVEGSSYHLKPNDILIARDNEMHQVYHRSGSAYERIIINIQNSFFEQNSCPEYRDIFLERTPGLGNKIDGEIALASGIFDTIARMERFIREGNRKNDTIIKCALVEFLYLLNRLKTANSESTPQNELVKKVMDYVKENLNQPLDLDLLSDNFFVSKYHLCRIFKKNTGFTINHYLTSKRILRAAELHRTGQTLSEASLEAGFSSYSSFYKAYIKETGMSPKKGLLHETMEG